MTQPFIIQVTLKQVLVSNSMPSFGVLVVDRMIVAFQKDTDDRTLMDKRLIEGELEME